MTRELGIAAMRRRWIFYETINFSRRDPVKKEDREEWPSRSLKTFARAAASVSPTVPRKSMTFPRK
jgi:hypothetical protein